MPSFDIRTFLTDLTRWKGHKIDPKKIQHTYIWGMTSDGTPYPITNDTGLLSGDEDKKGLTAENVPEDNSDAVVSVTVDEVWEIRGIYGGMVAAVAALSRTIAVQVVPLAPVGIALSAPVLLTSTVTLTSGEVGHLWLSRGPHHWTDDDGAGPVKVADENPLPMRLEGGATITLINTAGNSHADDRLGLKVHYDKVS